VAKGKIGIRVPDHSFFSSVMATLGQPLFGTSVNRSGEPPLEDIEQMIEHFSGVDLIVEGSSGAGVPSAIIDLTVSPPQALRGELPAGLR
jgi:L-threonylcarbamoyladenylate synthase